MSKKSTNDEIRLALRSTSTRREAAAMLGIGERALRKRIAKMGNVPTQEARQRLTGRSQLVDGITGEVKLEWLKYAEDASLAEAHMQAVLEAMQSKIPRVQPVPAPRRKTIDELMNLIVVTDYHMGMLAWGEEAGADWDMKIAERLLLDWFGYILDHAPAASHCAIAQLGDFLHYDGFESVTPSSNHILDADSRPQKMIRVSLRCLRQLIEMALRKYETVYVLMAEGNHDLLGSAWLRETFAIMYENEDRVQVETRPDPYYAHVWGRTALFFHHGHLRKTTNVSDVFVRKFREEYGQCLKAYAHMGHLHHKDSKENSLMLVEQHPTLAAADAYASRGGWLSERVASAITYHKEFGEIGRTSATPEMVERDDE